MSSPDAYKIVEWEKRLNDQWSDHNCTRITLAAIGTANAGKTCFLYRLLHGKFDAKRVSTVSVDFMQKLVMAPHPTYDEKMRVTLTDTIGDDRMWHACVANLKRAQGVFLCFDMADQESFSDCKNWIKLLRGENTYAVCMLVGLKSDKYDELPADEKWMEQVDLRHEATKLGCIDSVCRVSSKLNTGTAEALMRLIDAVRENEDEFADIPTRDGETGPIDIAQAKRADTKKCCN